MRGQPDASCCMRSHAIARRVTWFRFETLRTADILITRITRGGGVNKSTCSHSRSIPAMRTFAPAAARVNALRPAARRTERGIDPSGNGCSTFVNHGGNVSSCGCVNSPLQIQRQFQTPKTLARGNNFHPKYIYFGRRSHRKMYVLCYSIRCTRNRKRRTQRGVSQFQK
jgi:hypothetical protein